MGAAEHGADFPLAKKLRASMTHQQLHDFAVGSEKNKPERVTPAKPRAPRTPRPTTAAAPDPNHESHSYNWRSRANLKRGNGY
jgi:hypothetical protein